MNCSNCHYGSLVLLSNNGDSIFFSCSVCNLVYKLDVSNPSEPEFSFKDGVAIVSGLANILGIFGIDDISEILDIF